MPDVTAVNANVMAGRCDESSLTRTKTLTLLLADLCAARLAFNLARDFVTMSQIRREL